MATATVLPHPDGLALLPSGEVLPLTVASYHYFHHPREDWGRALDALVVLGFRIVDTYVPWGIHERSKGDYDFGQKNPRLALRAFLSEVHARGLFAIVRPGPHINGELSFFGLPERVVWDAACQARTPKGNPVILPMLPLAFPVPSYASQAFHAEASQWLIAAAKQMGDLTYPKGPIVAVQIDNEGALYFRDGPYDQDFHPDSVDAYRDFLRKKYSVVEKMQEAYGDASLEFSTIDPPRRFDGRALPRHLEWMEFQEDLLARAMGRFADALLAGGLEGIPTTHNFPLGEAASPLNAARIGDVVDIVALDYYHRATPEQHASIARRTTELAAFCEARGRPAYGAEIGCGFPPFFPPLDEKDSQYTLLAALAYGLRGYNLYMAVDRDRWLGAPISAAGIATPGASFYGRLNSALRKLAFHTLRRHMPVRLLVPRALRRLARASHAFGPLSPSAFHVMGRSVAESCFEDDLGLAGGTAPGGPANLSGGTAPGGPPNLSGESEGDSASPVVQADAFLRRAAEALQARGVPFAFTGGEGLADPQGHEGSGRLDGAAWVIVGAAEGLKPELAALLRETGKNARVTLGPRVPTLDGSLRPLAEPFNAEGISVVSLWDASGAADAVGEAIREDELPTYPVEGQAGFVTVHHDLQGVVRAVFAMNPYPDDRVLSFSIPKVRALTDLLGETPRTVTLEASAFRVPVAGRTVSLFAAVPETA